MAVSKRAKGRYEVAIELGFDAVAGRRRRMSQSVLGTKKDAERVERELLAQRDRGISLVGDDSTVAEYLERWLSDYAKANVAPSTFVRYGIAVRKHLIPHLGHLRLRDIQPVQVQDLHRICRAEGLAQSTVRQHHRILSKALKLAVQWQLIHYNPAASISAPRVDRHELSVLDRNGIRGLLAFAKDDPLFPFTYLAAQTGARNGELCGLRWSDVDLEASRLAIRRTAQRLPGEDLQMRSTKTHRSKRSLSLSPDTVEFLRALRSGQGAMFAGGVVPDSSPVLPQPNGLPFEPGQISHAFSRLSVRAGLPEGFRFHDLRHTQATQLMNAGIHPKVVSERLGHATVSITLDTYSHVLPSIQDEAALAMDAILAPEASNEEIAGEAEPSREL